MNEMTQSMMTKNARYFVAENLMIMIESTVFLVTSNSPICSADQSIIMDIDKEDEQIDTNFGKVSMFY